MAFGFDKNNIDLNSSAFFEELQQEKQIKKVTQHKRELTIRDLPEGITMAKVDIDNMSEEEFERLPESEKKKYRGDFV